MDGAMKVSMGNRITAKGDNKGLAPMSMDIGRSLPEELYVAVCSHDVIISNHSQ
jgi:hypothetical protein